MKLDFLVSTNHTLVQYKVAKLTNRKPNHTNSSTVPPCLICIPSVSLNLFMAPASTMMAESRIAATNANNVANAGQKTLK